VNMLLMLGGGMIRIYRVSSLSTVLPVLFFQRNEGCEDALYSMMFFFWLDFSFSTEKKINNAKNFFGERPNLCFFKEKKTKSRTRMVKVVVDVPKSVVESLAKKGISDAISKESKPKQVSKDSKVSKPPKSVSASTKPSEAPKVKKVKAVVPAPVDAASPAAKNTKKSDNKE